MGSNCNFVGQVGDDNAGKKVIDLLKSTNINTDFINVLKNEVTGQAYILSYPDGNNSIIIVGGANTSWDVNKLDFVDKSLENSKCLIINNYKFVFQLIFYCCKGKLAMK